MSAATAPTLQRMLLAAREHAAAGLRFVDGGERERFESWGAIATRAARVAGRLAAAGVAPGERVALVYPTSPEFFDAFFGALFAGAVPVPLYPPVRLARLGEYHERTADMLRAAGAVLLLADRRLLPLVGEAAAAAAPERGAFTLDELLEAEPLTREGDPEALGLVQFSSGTTVEPKPVALTHRALVAQVAALNSFWPGESGRQQSCVSWLPLYHDMGLIGAVLPALALPAVTTLVPPERFVARPALWLRALARHRATVSVAPNFAYALATERIRDEELDGCDLSAWRVALCGAETVSAATLRGFAARFTRWGFRAAALTPVYGLSEAALAVTFGEIDRPFSSLRVDRALLAGEAGEARAVLADDGVELVTVGRPLPGFAVELRDRSGVPVPAGRIGRLFVRGPSLFRDYLGRPEATAAAFADGWLDTGDLGFLHAGELVLTGRAKDVLIVRGANHPPEEVERAVDALPGVRRGCAVAVSTRDEAGATERVLLFVEHRRGAARAVLAALPARCREAVAGATGLVVDEVHVVAPGTLPRTSSGKLRRGETLLLHANGRLVPAPRFGVLALAGAALRGRRALARAGLAGRAGRARLTPR